MHKVVVVALAGWLTVVAAPGLGRAQAEESPAPKQTIQGVVEVGDTDEEGHVVSVSIWDDDEGAVLITAAGKGRELLRLVGAVVEATGTLRPHEDDSDYGAEMDVDSYKVVEPAEPEPSE